MSEDRIIVTGGAGFIGSAVVRYLVGELGVRTAVLDKLTYAGNLSSLKTVSENPLYSFHQIDILDRDKVGALFDAFKPTGVMHLAAESHVDRSITGAEDFIQTNILGTFRLLEEARRYFDGLSGPEQDDFRFLNVSTDEVYGSLGADGLFHETTPYDPSSPYSASKASADHLTLAWRETYGLPTLISNCSNNYGPYHFPEKLIPLMILNALDGGNLPVYGDGSNVRDWLYVDDHARALYTILKTGKLGEKYNVGGRNERTNLEVVQTICRILDEKRPKTASYADQITYVTDRPGHDARYAIDATKLEDELGWKAVENFDTGIERTIDWYLDNEWWWRPLHNAALERRGLIKT